MVAALAAGCGPAVDVPAGGGSTSSDSTAGTSASGATPNPTGSAPNPTETSPPSVTTSSTTAFPGDTEASTGALSTTGIDPTGADCPDLTPVDPPTTPRGCTAAPLVDADNQVIPGSHSGVVVCPEDGAPDDHVVSVYRVARVACPYSTGNCTCDADCPNGQQCLCDFDTGGWPNQDGNRCVPADCASDEDCDGGRCRAESGFCGDYQFPTRFHCTSPEDDCTTNTTCILKGGLQYCAYDETVEMFTCSPGAICE